MSLIKIDPDRRIGNISRNLFGGFAEHLGRCIYGGLYDPDSRHADAHGFRTDVLEQLRALRMPLMRWPGGNFASGYHWRDGVGPTAARPTRMELAWGTTESNRFGTDEFVQLCRVAGWEPFFAVNMGTGSLDEARDWVEYCNRPPATTTARLRSENGFPEPHGVKYWALGNEVYGHWQIGHKDAEAYAIEAREYAKVMRWVDPSIKLVACGADSPDWDRAVLKQVGKQADYISIHFYVGNREKNFGEYMATGRWIDERLEILAGTIVSVLGPRTPMRISVDEWNVWYRTMGNSNTLEEVYNYEDALVVAQFLHSFIRHANWVTMANLAQVVNVIAPLVTRGDDLIRQTIYHPFAMLSQAVSGAALHLHQEGETYASKHGEVPYLDAAAALREDGTLVLSVVNRHPSDAIRTEVRNQGTHPWVRVTGQQLAGHDPQEINSFEQPDQVHPAPVESRPVPGGQAFTYQFPPASLTVLEIH